MVEVVERWSMRGDGQGAVSGVPEDSLSRVHVSAGKTSVVGAR